MQYTLKRSSIATIDRLSWYIHMINLSISISKNDLMLQLSKIELIDIVWMFNVVKKTEFIRFRAMFVFGQTLFKSELAQL